VQATDKADFLKVINGIAAIRKSPITAEALELWWACMADWSIEDFKTAAIQVLKTSTFMPTPKDFEDLRKAGRETAGEVFAGIGRYLVYSPNGYTVKADTPRPIAAAIRAMGGADAYAMCEVDKLPFLERRFCEHYEQIMSHVETRDAVPQIAYGKDPLQLGKVAGTFIAIGKQD
jgi:hypothetical protein